MIHVLVSYYDVTAAMNANQQDKSIESNLGYQRYTNLPYSADEADLVPSVSSPKQIWSDDDVDARGIIEDSLIPEDGVLDRADKRKWAKNTVRVWGKRSDVDQDRLNADDNESGEHVYGAKRSWSKNKVRVWGKRNLDEEMSKWHEMSMTNGGSSVETALKRKWSNNKVRVWGKRGHDDEEGASQLDLSSYLVSATDRRERPTVKSRLPAVATSVAAKHHSKTSTTGQHRGSRTGASDNNDVTENEPVVIDDVLRKRAAIVKRAIDESIDRNIDRLAWVPGEKTFFTSDPSSPLYEERWISAAKRVGSAPTTYIGGGGSPSSARVGRYPFYSAEGPKRSWRTNVIRVWG